MNGVDPAFGGIPVEDEDEILEGHLDPAFGAQAQQPVGLPGQPEQIAVGQQMPAPTIGTMGGQAPAAGGSMLDRIKGALSGMAKAQPATAEAPSVGPFGGSMDVVKREEFPEIHVLHTEYVNPFEAKTDKGKLNLLKRNFKTEDRDALSMDYDKFGNLLVKVNRPAQSEAFPGSKLEPGVYYLDRPALSQQDIRKLGPLAEGAVLPGLASVGLRGKGMVTAMGGVGLAGATGEALEQVEAERLGAEEGYNISDIIKVGAFSALGEGGGRILAKTYDAAVEVGRKLMGSKVAPVLDDAGNFTDDFINAMNEKGVDLDDVTDMMKAQMRDMPGDLTPEQEMNKALWDALDIEPTRPMVTREFGEFRTQEQLRGLAEEGFDIRQRLSDIDESMFAKLHSMKTGGTTDDAIAAMQSVKESVLRKQATANRLVRRQYEKVRANYGEAAVDTPNIVKIVEEAQDDVLSTPAVGDIKNKLIRIGVMDKEGKYLKGLTVTQAEDLRKTLTRKSLTGGETGHNMRNMRNALDDDVLGSLGEDAFGEARALAARNFREFKDRKIVKQLVGDKWDDQSFIDKAVKSRAVTYNQIQELKDTLLTGSKAQQARGKMAFDDVRGATVKWLADQAKQGRVLGVGDKPMFSGANFSKALETIGDRKLKVIFTPDEVDFLRTIEKAGKLKTPIPGTINLSGTSAAWWDMANRVSNAFPPLKILFGTIKATSHGAEKMKLEAAGRRLLRPAAAEAAKTKAGEILPPVGAAIGAIEGRE